MGKNLNILCFALGILSYGWLLFSTAFDLGDANAIVFSTSAILFTMLGIDGIRNDAK